MKSSGEDQGRRLGVNQEGQECKMTLFPAVSTLWEVIALFALGGDWRFDRERMDVLWQLL